MPHTHRWAALLPVAAHGLVTACGGDGASDNGEGGDGPTLSFANSYTEDHPHTRCGIDAVAEEVSDADVGMEIDTFPNSQLGDNTETFDSVMSGDIDLDVQGSAALGTAYEPIGVFDSAYTFDDADHMFDFFDSEASDGLKADFESATGTRILDVWYFGDRHFTANDPIRSPEDLDGLRMRFPDTPIYLANAEAMGANATAVAFEEVYLALQQGTVDGQENPIPTISGDSFDEVQSHISLTSHQIGSQMIVVSGETWDSLDGEQQDALQEAVSEVRELNRECIEEDEAEILSEWENSGEMEVVDDVDVDAFREAAHAYFDDYFEGEEHELYTAIRDAR
jgi:TRAP-type transport system periplasmic protein